MKILIVYSKSYKNSARLADGLNRIDHENQYYKQCFEDLEFYMDKAEPSVFSVKYQKDIAEFDYFYIRQFSRNDNFPLALTLITYLKSKGKKFIAQDLENNYVPTKLNQSMLLATSNIPAIPSYYATGELTLVRFKDAPLFPYPLIMKDIKGSLGRNNFLVRDYAELAANFHAHKQVRFIVQPFIPNHYDYRVLVFFNKTYLIMKRARINENSHLNNISQGAKASIIDLAAANPELLSISQKAAALMHKDIAGVDVLAGEDGRLYVMEVNGAAHLVTGANTEMKMAAFQKALAEKIIQVSR